MKKLLSLVLVLVMALSLTVPAFAGEKTMITEVNLTVGKTYTDLDTGVSVSVPDEADYTASYGGMEFVVGSDVYFYQITGGDANLWLNMPSYAPCGTPPDVSNADKVFAVINLFTKDWQTHAFAINDELTVTCNGRTINHKAQAASEEGWFSVGGISYQVLIDITPSKTSGSSTITATKEEPELAYTIVIPTATELTEEAHTGVQLGGNSGKASITVTTASAKTNVYYTVDLTNGTLTDGKNTITTSYAYAQGGDYSALTGETKVTVYEGGEVKDSTIQVTADETSWAAAPAGTYTASVVFNFATEEAGETTFATVANLLATVEGGFPQGEGSKPDNTWRNENDSEMYCNISGSTTLRTYKDAYGVNMPVATEVTKSGNDYVCTVSSYCDVMTDVTWTFTVENNALVAVSVSGAIGNWTVANGTYTAPTVD